MARDLLLRGMIAGVIAAGLAMIFARLFAEPQIDLAIAFEAARDRAEHAMAEPELVSRATQKGIGLFTALLLYGAAIGGIFSLVFAAAYGRAAMIGPRSLAMVLAFAAFLVVALVPAFKYPPNPPAVGLHETVGLRTAAYFAMVALSILALTFALRMRTLLAGRLGGFNAALAACAIFIAVVGAIQNALPAINEVPANFPAVVLWNFRVASLATQAVLWAAIGTVFGAFANGLLQRG